MASRLTQLQARFQQKQMQEKEEKLLKLYENQQQRAFEKVGRNSAGSNTSIGSTGKGQVRSIYEERRKAGVDKSYPLEPLKSKITNGGKPPNRTAINSTSKTVVKSTVRTIKNGKSIANGTVHKMSNINSYRNGVHEESNKIHRTSYSNNNNNYSDTVDEVDHQLVNMLNNHNLNGNSSQEDLPKIGFSCDNSLNGSQLNVNGKLPNAATIKSITSQSTDEVKSNLSHNKKTLTKRVAPQRSISNNSRLTPSASSSTTLDRSTPMSQKQTNRAPTNIRPSIKQTVKSPVIRDDLAECRYCSRRFATDRLDKHEDICGKTARKKRKAYDATKHRVRGTELESYVLKGARKGGAAAVSSSKAASKPTSKKDWRRTHEEFIAAIRSAKQTQAYIAKGGKLSDLPPPPPSTNPDYVQCPHCGRRFNESAAARHIPKCATYQFNKPKGGAQSKRKP